MEESAFEKTLSPFELEARRRQQELLRAERELNAKLDRNIAAKINKHPSAIYYIIPNEFAERFCFYGVKNILLFYLVAFAGFTKDEGKAQTHLFTMLVYFFPIFGSALSDSFLAKYHTIVTLSTVYFIGTSLLAAFSINNWLGSYDLFTSGDGIGTLVRPAPYWVIIIPLLLIAIGTGGIKPCVSSHGGDQYLPTQTILLTKFFSYFYIAINVGSVMTGIITPLLKDVSCMGADTCYVLAFSVPAIVFGIALIVFIIGKKSYRIVPAAGGFLPWTALKASVTSLILWKNASNEQRREMGGVLNFGVAAYGSAFIDEIRLLGKVFFMILPYMCFWMIYDQGSTEWQLQYEHMDNRFGSIVIPAEISGNLNSFFIIVCLPILAKFVYPFLEKRGLSTRPLGRMMVGFFICIVAFAIGAFVQEEVDSRFEAAKAAGGVVMNGKRVEKCDGCLHGMWQIPQWFIMTVGEIMTSPTGLEFVYNEVGPRFRATSSALWLLMVAFGNLIVVSVTTALETAEWKRSHMDFLYCGVALVVLMGAYAQWRWLYVYKADRTDIDSTLVKAGVYDPDEVAMGHLPSYDAIPIPGETENDEEYRRLMKEKEKVIKEEKTLFEE